MTKEEAKAKYDSKFWEHLTATEIVDFQLFEERLCMPFEVFHKAVENVLGRPVWAHEFLFKNKLKSEYFEVIGNK